MFRRSLLIVSVLVIAFAGVAVSGDMEEANKKHCMRFYDEVVNKGDMSVFDELAADDFVEHEVFPGLPANKEGVRQFFTMMRTAFPDLQFKVNFMVAEGDKVAAYITMSGTHKGEFMGMAPTGKKFEINAVDIIQIADGKAVAHWGVTDVMKMMQDLGMMPMEGAHEHGEGGHEH